MIAGRPQMAQVLHPLIPVAGKPFTHMPGPAIEHDAAGAIITKWQKRFPIPTGHDNPREVAAYLLMSIYQTDILKKEAPKLPAKQQAVINDERKILPKLLGMTTKKH